MERIECKGRLFGVEPASLYPARRVLLEPSDRFLLYTDGVTETENAVGEAFGDRQREQAVRDNRLQTTSELLRLVLSERQSWRPAAVSQQNDITLSLSMFCSRPGSHLKSPACAVRVSGTEVFTNPRGGEASLRSCTALQEVLLKR